MTNNYKNAKLNYERKNIELEFARQKKLTEDELLLNHVYDDTELPDWE